MKIWVDLIFGSSGGSLMLPQSNIDDESNISAYISQCSRSHSSIDLGTSKQKIPTQPIKKVVGPVPVYRIVSRNLSKRSRSRSSIVNSWKTPIKN